MIGSKGKVYCSMGYTSVANWIVSQGFELTSDINEADVVAFAGGQDIDTGFYKEPKGSKTGTPGERDRREQADFTIATKTGKKIVGVCRGAQLICALSGGKLIQHVNNHTGGDHGLSTYDRQTMRVNSIHHQMMYPYSLDKSNYDILGWSSRPLSNTYLNGWNREVWLPNSFKETEIVHFKNTKGLAIQFHPEMMHRSPEFEQTNNWLSSLFLQFYNNEL